MARLAEQLNLRNPQLVRRVWGTGIGVVMLLAVGPYPIIAFFVDSEIPHRIHNIVGALQYLPLWAVPVLLLTWERDPLAAWRIALVSSCAIFGIGLLSGDLIPSLSWMPLVTLLPLWRTRAWRHRRRPSVMSLVAVALGAVVTLRHAPQLVDLQRLDMGDSHSVRFHFSGMAAAYVALTGSMIAIAVHPAGRTLRLVVAACAAVAGLTSLMWSNYESALPSGSAWMLVAAGTLIGLDAGMPRAGQTRATGTRRHASAHVDT